MDLSSWSRRRCRTFEGEDALKSLGEDAKGVEEAVVLGLMSQLCIARAHGLLEAVCTGSRVHGGRGPVCTGLAEQPTRVLKLALHGHVDVDACVYLPEMVSRKSLHLSVFSKMRKTACGS